jgi:hypothetical protein
LPACVRRARRSTVSNVRLVRSERAHLVRQQRRTAASLTVLGSLKMPRADLAAAAGAFCG